MKRGATLLENWIEIVVAALGILLIAFLISLIYNPFLDQEADNSKKLIDNIDKKIGLLEDGQSGKFLFQSPCSGKAADSCNWYLVAWNFDDPDRPEKCYFDNCICICKHEKTEVKRLDFKTSCQDKSFCRNFDRKVKASSIDSSMVGGDELLRDFVRFTNLKELIISKSKELIEIRSE